MRYGRLSFERFEYYLKPLKERWKNSFPNSVVERCYKHIHDLPPDSVERIVNAMIDDSRYAPLPKDFREAARLERNRTQNYHSPNSGSGESYEEPPKCADCGGVGLVEVVEKGYDHPAQVRMFCHCEAGAKDEGRHKLPRWERSFAEHYEIIPNDKIARQWKPTAGRSFDQLVEAWKEKTRISEMYWEQQHREYFEQEFQQTI